MVNKRDLLEELSIRVNEQKYPDGRTDLLLQYYDQDIRTFYELIDTKPEEEKIQLFLEEHPVILLHAMLDGFYPAASTRSSLFSKVQLGGRYQTDFAFCSLNSMGAWWTFVELERSDVPIFTKKGDPSKYLMHAIRQVMDWQAWLVDFSEYAASELHKLFKDRTEGFYHANYLRKACNAVIVIGRRANLTPETNRRRIQICTENPRLEIITYDRLFDGYWVDKEEQLRSEEARNIREIL